MSRCTLYTPGHAVHWIHARTSWHTPSENRLVTLVSVASDEAAGSLTLGVDCDGEELTWLVHSCSSARSAVALWLSGAPARLVSHGLVAISEADGRSARLLNPCTDTWRWRPCQQ